MFGMSQVAGKHGKRRSFRCRRQKANERSDRAATPIVWRNDARRSLVDAAAASFCRVVDFHRVFHVGGVSGTELFLWQLHLALLFARNFRRITSQLVWTKTGLVAAFFNLFSCVVGPLGAGWIPIDLLLLSRRLLQGILGGSSRMHSRRAAKKLLGRALLPADHAECAPLFPLSGALFPFDSGV